MADPGLTIRNLPLVSCCGVNTTDEAELVAVLVDTDVAAADGMLKGVEESSSAFKLASDTLYCIDVAGGATAVLLRVAGVPNGFSALAPGGTEEEERLRPLEAGVIPRGVNVPVGTAVDVDVLDNEGACDEAAAAEEEGVRVAEASTEAVSMTPSAGPPTAGPSVIDGPLLLVGIELDAVKDGPPSEGPPSEGPPREGPPREGPPSVGPPNVGPVVLLVPVTPGIGLLKSGSSVVDCANCAACCANFSACSLRSCFAASCCSRSCEMIFHRVSMGGRCERRCS